MKFISKLYKTLFKPIYSEMEAELKKSSIDRASQAKKVWQMDKQIRNIEKTIKKDTKKEEKELKTLEKADKKRDKVCDYGQKMMKKKK